ncbi:MAG: hypothetical protein ACM3Q1_05375 [Bacteroidales bacterium]
MPRLHLLAPMALMVTLPLMAQAAGRPAAETCFNAGYRMGTVGFDMCVARVGGDDPLSALEGGELAAHGDKGARRPNEIDPLAAVVPGQPRPQVAGAAVPLSPAREEIPASFNTPTPVPAPPAPPPYSAPSAPPMGPTWPTPPTMPQVTPPTPPWNFGSQ